MTRSHSQGHGACKLLFVFVIFAFDLELMKSYRWEILSTVRTGAKLIVKMAPTEYQPFVDALADPARSEGLF